MSLNAEALQAHEWALEKGIPVDTVEEIIKIVLDQEIVTYCSQHGTVSFDIYDVEFS
jgi:hypothetical protein